MTFLAHRDSLEGCERITVVKFRMDNGGGNGVGCLKSSYGRMLSSPTVLLLARFRRCRDFISKGEMLVKHKANVASGMRCVERGVMYFGKLLFKSNKKKFSFRRVKIEKISSHPEKDLLQRFVTK